MEFSVRNNLCNLFFNLCNHRLKIMSLCLSFVLIFPPHCVLADRSNAGGGDTAEFDFGNVAMSAGITLGAMAVTSAIGAGLSSWAGQLGTAGGTFTELPGLLVTTSPGIWASVGNSLANSFSFAGLATNYGSFAAASQAGRAMAMAGNYYDWDPSTTFLASSTVVGATGGLLNPSVALGRASDLAMPSFSGMLVGGLTGFASSGVIVAIDGDRMDDISLTPDERRPGVGAQIAGMAAGLAAGVFARELVNPATYIDKDSTLSTYKGRNYEFQIEVPQDSQTYQLLDNSGKEIPGQIPLTRSDIEALYSSPETYSRDIRIISTGDSLRIAAPASASLSQIGWRLTGEVGIKTLDMWPQLTAGSLAIIAADSIPTKDERGRNINSLFTPSVVSSLVQGVATPIFAGIAHNLAEFGSKPSLFIGENSEQNYKAYEVSMKQEIARQYGEQNKGKYPVDIDHPTEQEAILAKQRKIMEAGTLPDAREVAGTSWGAVALLPWRNTSFLKEIGYGLMEGAIQVGISSLISKTSKGDNSLRGASLDRAAASYGAALVSGAIRGAVQKWMYDKDAMKIAEDAAGTIEDRRMREVRKQELNEYKTAMAGYDTAILTSMAQANRDFLDRSLSFGAPRGDPRGISVFGMMDYLDKLNAYARAAAQGPGWFASALTSSLTSAGSAVTANNVITSLGTTPWGQYLIAPYTNAARSAGRGETYTERK